MPVLIFFYLYTHISIDRSRYRWGVYDWKWTMQRTLVQLPAIDNVITTVLVEGWLKRLSELSCQLQAIWTRYIHCGTHSSLPRLEIPGLYCQTCGFVCSLNPDEVFLTAVFADYTLIHEALSFLANKAPQWIVWHNAVTCEDFELRNINTD